MTQPIIVEVESVSFNLDRIRVKSFQGPVVLRWKQIEESFLCMGTPPYDERLPEYFSPGQKLILFPDEIVRSRTNLIRIKLGPQSMYISQFAYKFWCRIPEGLFVE